MRSSSPSRTRVAPFVLAGLVATALSAVAPQAVAADAAAAPATAVIPVILPTLASPPPAPAAPAPQTPGSGEPAMPVSWMGFEVGGDCHEARTQQAFDQLARRGYELPEPALRCPVEGATPVPLRLRLRKLAADGSVSEVEDLSLAFLRNGGLARIVWTRAWAPGVAAPSEASLRDEVFAQLGAPALVYDRVLPPAPQPVAVDEAASAATATPAPAPAAPAGDGLAFTAAWSTVQKNPLPTTLFVLNAADWSRGTSRMGGVMTVAHVSRVSARDASRPQYLRIDMRDSGYRAGR